MAATLKHELPGRLRFSAPHLKRNRWAAEQLRAVLGSLAGVRSVEVSALTGSVLVMHDGDPATREMIFRTIAHRTGGLALTRPLRGPAPATRAHPLLAAVVEKLLERLLGAVAAVI